MIANIEKSNAVEEEPGCLYGWQISIGATRSIGKRAEREWSGKSFFRVV